jgi:UDP:flavonoid glycosyltransferase YjiC (YdhE family)
MGHFNPICNVGTALVEAGHDVTILTHDDPFIREKAKNYSEDFGIKMAYKGEGKQSDLLEAPKGCKDQLNEQ